MTDTEPEVRPITEEPPEPEVRLPWVWIAILGYVPLALAVVAWIGWQHGTETLRQRLVGSAPLPELGLGIVVGAAMVLVSWGLERVLPSFSRLGDAMGRIVGPMSVAHCALLALLSAVGEELFFRGALQPAFGLWIASGIFACMHAPIERDLILWPVFAFGAGLIFGWLYARTGCVIAPAAAHFTVNLVNLIRLVASLEDPAADPGSSSPSSPPPPEPPR